MNLNPEQQAAVNAREGAFCVLAGPGSGKTSVIVERIRVLLKDGATTSDILALTFTVEAAHEMERRLNLKVPKTDRGGFRTFHSFGLNLIRKEAAHLPYGLSANPIPEGNVLSKMLVEAMKSNGVPRREFEAIQAYVSKKKRERISSEEAVEKVGPWGEESKAKVYQTYQKRLRDGGMLDYDDMIVEAVTLLEKEEVRDRWQFKYVLCDEGQDTDDNQFRILQSVSARHGNIFCVGDFCQALYEFRGAAPENLLRFGSWFPGSKTLYLGTNYRSTPQIVSFCKASAPIRNELTENLRTPNGSGSEIEFRMYNSSIEEAESTLAEALTNPGGSAILFRTNAQSGIFETLCVEHGQKFYLLGKSGMWDQPELRQLISLVGFVLSTGPATNYPQELVLPLRAMRNYPAADILKRIIDRSGMEKLYADEDYSEDENFALANLQAAVRIAGRFTTLSEFANHARKAAHASRKSKNALTLSTVHQAKGLEWPNVFVVGVQEGILPHKKGDLAEERRIFFVAISRAAKRLRISFSGSPSSFVTKHLTPEIEKQLRANVEKVERIQKQISIPFAK